MIIRLAKIMFETISMCCNAVSTPDTFDKIINRESKNEDLVKHHWDQCVTDVVSKFRKVSLNLLMSLIHQISTESDLISLT